MEDREATRKAGSDETRRMLRAAVQEMTDALAMADEMGGEPRPAVATRRGGGRGSAALGDRVGDPRPETATQREGGQGFASLGEMAGTLRQVEWLWPQWIPRGMVTMLGAAPGMGKSLVALDLARRMLAGEAWPDGAPAAEGGRKPVVIVDAEGIPEVIAERAAAWGMDRERMYLMKPPKPAHFIDLGNLQHLKVMAAMGRELRPGLVVVDSLSTATAGGETSLSKARLLLTMLARLAAGLNAGMVVIHHMRKGRARTGRKAGAEELRGTSHLGAATRSVITMTTVGAEDGVRKLEVVKSNLCRRPPALYVAIEAGAGGVAAVRYMTEPPLEAAAEEVGPCARWLVEFLGDGRLSRAGELAAAAERAGFSRAALYRAREALGARIEVGRREGEKGKWWGVKREA